MECLGETVIRHIRHYIQSGYLPIYSVVKKKRDVLASTARQRMKYTEFLSSCCSSQLARSAQRHLKREPLLVILIV